jgi:phage baseplate assembly protein W
MDVAFPWRFDEYGRTARSPYGAHVREMLEQLLLVGPGERVMRPDFGAGLQGMVFAPNSPEVAAALQYNVQAAIERWLGDVVAVERLAVTAEEAVLSVALDYRLRPVGDVTSITIRSPGAP